MSSVSRDPVTLEKLVDPWNDNCYPACHTMNKSTWDDLASRSTDGSFQCPISRNILTIDSLRRNTLIAELIAERDSDKEIKKIMKSFDPLSLLIQKMDTMNQTMLDRDAKSAARADELHAKIDTLTKVFIVSHKQVMNLSNIS